jgi:hypothetical protein
MNFAALGGEPGRLAEYAAASSLCRRLPILETLGNNRTIETKTISKTRDPD